MIGPSGPLDGEKPCHNIYILALEFSVNKCKKQNGGAPDLSQSDCVRCRHHVAFKGPPFLVFRNRVVLFRKFMFNALQALS